MHNFIPFVPLQTRPTRSIYGKEVRIVSTELPGVVWDEHCVNSALAISHDQRLMVIAHASSNRSIAALSVWEIPTGHLLRMFGSVRPDPTGTGTSSGAVELYVAPFRRSQLATGFH